MQSTPFEAGRAPSRTDSPGDPGGDTVLPARVPESTPTLVLRPRVQCRLVGPAIVVVAFALVALGRLWGVVLLPFAVPFVSSLWVRVEVGSDQVRRRDWRGRWSSVSMDHVDMLRLRRLPFAVLRWLPRGYRIGRFWTIPLTLRLQSGEDVRLEIRCVWWKGWRDLARFGATIPGIDLDTRTRGRLSRYVGGVAPTTLIQS
ncbi:MAG: hypothetical protein ACXVKA_13930 [Acidimicrobiia bacterium]